MGHWKSNRRSWDGIHPSRENGQKGRNAVYPDLAAPVRHIAVASLDFRTEGLPRKSARWSSPANVKEVRFHLRSVHLSRGHRAHRRCGPAGQQTTAAAVAIVGVVRLALGRPDRTLLLPPRTTQAAVTVPSLAAITYLPSKRHLLIFRYETRLSQAKDQWLQPRKNPR